MVDKQGAEEWMEESEFHRVYGPQQSMTPTQVRDLLAGLTVPWWVAGGWAIEAFTGVPRSHEDIDISVFRRDEALVRAHLLPQFHLWSAGPSGLKHLKADTLMPDDSGQIWLREHALAPWRGEILLNADHDGQWESKRDPEFFRPLDEVTWQRDGVRYLNPEIVLVHKVKTGRRKDDVDLDATLPLLSPGQREVLRDYLERFAPDHPWRARV